MRTRDAGLKIAGGVDESKTLFYNVLDGLLRWTVQRVITTLDGVAVDPYVTAGLTHVPGWGCMQAAGPQCAALGYAAPWE